MERTEYTAESSMRRPGDFLKVAVLELLSRGTWALAWQLAHRNIAAAYRLSLLGYLWGVLPIVLVAFVFAAAAENRVIALGDTGMPYVAFAVIGLVLWQTFVESLTGPLAAMYQAKPMLTRINLSKEAFILSKIGEVLFHLLSKLVLVAAVIIWYQVPLAWSALLTPFGLLALITLGTTIGVILTPIGLLYDDVRRTLPIAVQMGLVVTPVIFALPRDGAFAAVVHQNPLTPLIITTREWLAGDPNTMLGPFIIVACVSLLALFLSLLGLRLVLPFAVERLGG